MGTGDDNDAAGAVALVLIDLQNSFFHPDGGNYYPASADIIPMLYTLLEKARATSKPIIHVCEQHRPGVQDFETTKLPEHCLAGSWDAAFFHGFGPADNNGSSSGESNGDSTAEFVLAKRRVSAFFATDLDLLLREQGTRRLLIAGCKANVCVRATVHDAFSLGYRCFIAREAVNSNRPHLAEAALEDIQRYLGWVVSMDEALALLA